MAMPMFRPGDDPGSSFPELLRRIGASPAAAAGGHVLDVPHATTCIALRYGDGVIMAGDRRATSGNLISHRGMEKVVQADRFSGVAIAGAGLQAQRTQQVIDSLGCSAVFGQETATPRSSVTLTPESVTSPRFVTWYCQRMGLPTGIVGPGGELASSPSVLFTIRIGGGASTK